MSKAIGFHFDTFLKAVCGAGESIIEVETKKREDKLIIMDADTFGQAIAFCLVQGLKTCAGSGGALEMNIEPEAIKQKLGFLH